MERGEAEGGAAGKQLACEQRRESGVGIAGRAARKGRAWDGDGRRWQLVQLVFLGPAAAVAATAHPLSYHLHPPPSPPPPPLPVPFILLILLFVLFFFIPLHIFFLFLLLRSFFQIPLSSPLLPRAPSLAAPSLPPFPPPSPPASPVPSTFSVFSPLSLLSSLPFSIPRRFSYRIGIAELRQCVETSKCLRDP